MNPNVQTTFGNPAGLGIHFQPNSPDPWGTRTAITSVKAKLAILPSTPTGIGAGGASDWIKELPAEMSPLNLGLIELGVAKDAAANVELDIAKA